MLYPSLRGLLPLKFHRRDQEQGEERSRAHEKLSEEETPHMQQLTLSNSDFRIYLWKSQSNYVNYSLSADEALKWHHADEHHPQTNSLPTQHSQCRRLLHQPQGPDPLPLLQFSQQTGEMWREFELHTVHNQILNELKQIHET